MRVDWLGAGTGPIPPRPARQEMMRRTSPLLPLLLILLTLLGGIGLVLLSSDIGANPRIFILGDMEKPTGLESLRDSNDFWRDGKIRLHGAGNEVVAFQAVVQAYQPVEELSARIGRLEGPGATLAEGREIELSLAHYEWSRDASYSWGPGAAGALPWRGRGWPDALIPFHDPYRPDRPPVAIPFSLDPDQRRNQAIWVDLFIPAEAPAGTYEGTIEFLHGVEVFAVKPIELIVHPFRLPDERHVDGYGELYRETGLMLESQVKFKENPEQDWMFYRRYLQMAHAHRFLATHRQGNGPVPRTIEGAPADRLAMRWEGDWDLYSPYVDPVLDGSLFTEAEGYIGPSPGTGPSFFPAPFPEEFHGTAALADHLAAHGGRLDPALLATIEANAASFIAEATRQGWADKRFFAYIFDEVDGPKDSEGTAEAAIAPAAAGLEALAAHRAMADVQAALDRGTGRDGRIDLLWTSQQSPARWEGTPADLRPIIRWWVPNAHALDPDFYHSLPVEKPQTVWFYHSGHPAVGNHTINQTGIDLRLWGLLGWRYQINGSFWWSMMSFPAASKRPNFNPYMVPVYNLNDTRWGNGVLFYPGSRLTMIGARRNIAGPVASMRMKAYRRGLQDYEYCRLASRGGAGTEVNAMLRQLIPDALAKARGDGAGRWRKRPSDYYAMRRHLAGLITEMQAPAPR